MFKQHLAIALFALTPLGAGAYDTGNLTCDNIGQFAGQTLTAKQSGIPEDIYLSLLNDRLPGDATVERNLVARITTLIYQDDLLTTMEPADAYAAFQQDCLRGLAEDDLNAEDEDDDTRGEQNDGTGDQRT